MVDTLAAVVGSCILSEASYITTLPSSYSLVSTLLAGDAPTG